MVRINTKDKELIIKLVYYGPGLSGKTTNLQYIHKTTDPKDKTKLISLNTSSDRTLFFDLLPFDLGTLSNMHIRLQLYTVPGQSQYRSTRKTVLAGADGIAFVADSQRYMLSANIENLKDMKQNLEVNNLSVEKLPLVFQYNKRDLAKISSVNELNNVLNPSGYRFFEGIAIVGKGVFETLVYLLFDTIDYLVSEYDLSGFADDTLRIKKLIMRSLGKFSESPIAMEEVEQPVESVLLGKKLEKPVEIITEPHFSYELEDPMKALDKLRNEYTDQDVMEADAETQVLLDRENTSTDAYLVEAKDFPTDEKIAMTNSQLVERAVDSNMKISQLYVKMDELKRKLQEKINELSILHEVSLLLSSNEEVPEILKKIFKYSLELKQLTHGAMLVPRKSGYKQLISVGFSQDPLNTIVKDADQSVLQFLLQQKKIVAASLLNESSLIKQGIAERALVSKLEQYEIDAFVVAPLIAKGDIYGIFTLYQVNSPFEFTADDLDFLTSLSTSAAMVIENTKLKHKSQGEQDQALTQMLTHSKKLLAVTYKRVKSTVNTFDSLLTFLSSTAQTHLELLDKNEKEMNLRLKKNIERLLKE